MHGMRPPHRASPPEPRLLATRIAGDASAARSLPIPPVICQLFSVWIVESIVFDEVVRRVPSPHVRSRMGIHFTSSATRHLENSRPPLSDLLNEVVSHTMDGVERDPLVGKVSVESNVSLESFKETAGVVPSLSNPHRRHLDLFKVVCHLCAGPATLCRPVGVGGEARLDVVLPARAKGIGGFIEHIEKGDDG